MPSPFERALEAALVKHPEEGRGLDPQWETTQSLSQTMPIARSVDLPYFGGWRSIRSPCALRTIGIQSRAGEPCRFTIPYLAYRIGVEPTSSTFGGSRSSTELPVVIA